MRGGGSTGGGGGDRNRTDVWRFCRPLPYRLATPPDTNFRAMSDGTGQCPNLSISRFSRTPIRRGPAAPRDASGRSHPAIGGTGNKKPARFE